MDFALTETQQAIQATFRQFSDNEIRPLADDLDRNPRFPTALFRRAGELGYFGMRYPEPDGIGADVVSYVLATEEIARGSLAVGATCAMQSLMGTTFVQQFAQGEVRERLVGPAMAGEVIGGICMTEPDSGSDLFGMSTTATERGGTWHLNGCKTWVTSAPAADMFTVFARTGDKQLGIFLVEKGAAGLRLGRAIDKLGVRASLTSEVFFEDTPATCALGDPTRGTDALREVLAHIRVMTAALALGVAQAAFDDSVKYAAERTQFGRPINRFQLVQAHLADMAVDLEAARRMTHWAAWRSDQGLPNAHEASMAKLFASEAAARICDRASRVLASYGYAKEFPMERYLRDIRFTLIGGGTSEILRVNIAKGLGR
jgi:alkylation response protein AidB-like acyl-CoA dehydrogenase